MSGEITVIFYHLPNEAPEFFNVNLEDGWFNFADNQFFEKTGYPGIGLLIYDPETEVFIPMLTAGGLRIDEDTHPWIITRRYGLSDAECHHLDICIRHVLSIRDNDRTTLGIGNWPNGGGDGVSQVDGQVIVGDTNEIESNGTIQMVLDDDPDDLDYTEEASEEEESEEEAMDTDTEGEEEAMETDIEGEERAVGTDTEEEERKVIIDLTCLSESED